MFKHICSAKPLVSVAGQQYGTFARLLGVGLDLLDPHDNGALKHVNAVLVPAGVVNEGRAVVWRRQQERLALCVANCDVHLR